MINVMIKLLNENNQIFRIETSGKAKKEDVKIVFPDKTHFLSIKTLHYNNRLVLLLKPAVNFAADYVCLQVLNTLINSELYDVLTSKYELTYSQGSFVTSLENNFFIAIIINGGKQLSSDLYIRMGEVYSNLE